MEEKKSIIITFVLAVFIFMRGINYTFAQLETTRETTQQAPQIIIGPDIDYKASDLSDPFQALLPKEEKTPQGLQKETVAVTLPSLNVEGIIWGGKFPQAIINRKVVKVGDFIEGARIIAIDKDWVAVFFGNQKYNLPSPAAAGLETLEKKGGKDEKPF